MADDLAIAVTADTTSLRAQLALAQADMRAFTAEVRQTATALRSAGSDNSLLAQLNAQSAALDKTAAKVGSLRSEIKAAASAGGGFGNGIVAGAREGLDALAMMSSSLRQTAVVAGAAFAVDKIMSFAERMGELGERTINLAAAVGTTPHEFSLLTGALRLVTSESGSASRTLEILGKNLQEAVANPSSQAAKAATSLGISQQDLQRASTDLGFALDLLADKWVAFADSPLKTADFKELLGRGMETLVPILMGGSAAMEAFKKKAEETGIVLSDKDAAALAATGGKVHELSATLEGEGIAAFMHWKGAIDASIDGLQNLIKTAGAAINLMASITQWEQRQVGSLFHSGAPEMPDESYANLKGMPLERWRALRGQAASGAGHTSMGGVGTEPPPGSITTAQPAPWPTKTGGKGGGGSKGAAPIDAAFNLADSSAAAGERIDASYLSAFKANMEELKDKKRITVAQMLGFDIQYTAQLAAQDQTRLSSAMAAADAIAVKTNADAAKRQAAQLKVWEQEMELSARAAASIAQDQKKIADDAAAAAKKTAEEWAAPFKTAVDQIGSTWESGFKNLITARTGREQAQAWQGIYKGEVGAGLDLGGSILSKGSASLLGGKDGEGLGELVSGKLLGSLGLGGGGASQVTLLTTMNSLQTAGNAIMSEMSAFLATIAGATTETAAASTSTAGTTAATAAGAGGGLFSGIAAGWKAIGLPALFGAAEGGIVPAAAGGWSLPSSFGTDRILGALTPGETVLPVGERPSSIAESVRGMIAGAGGAGGDTHLHFHGPADGPAIQRFFTPIMRLALPGLVRAAFRSNGLTPRSL